jgi:transcriptional regulator with XRE-family HTH domain
MTGKELREWRKAMKYASQKAAADALGITERTYQRYEAGEEVSRLLELATQALSMRAAWGDLHQGLVRMSRLARH